MTEKKRENLISLFPQRKECTKKYVKVVRQTDDFIKFMQKTQRELNLHRTCSECLSYGFIITLYL